MRSNSFQLDSCTLQDYVPLLFSSPAKNARRPLLHVVFGFRPEEVEDEFALFNHYNRSAALSAEVVLCGLFVPVTIARWVGLNDKSCQTPACLLGLISTCIWLVCVGLLSYLYRRHMRLASIFSFLKNQTKEGLSLSGHLQDASPEAFATAALEAVLPADPSFAQRSTTTGTFLPEASTAFASAATDAASVVDTANHSGNRLVVVVPHTPTPTGHDESLLLSPAAALFRNHQMNVVSERRKHLEEARAELRRCAITHEIVCGFTMVALLLEALAFHAERDSCALGVKGIPVSEQTLCANEVQLEASFLAGSLITVQGIVPIRFAVLAPIQILSTAFLLAAWTYLRPSTNGVSETSQGVFILVCTTTVLVTLVLSYQRERRGREAFTGLCNVKANIASLVHMRHYAGSLMGPAIPLEVAKVVAARQELFDYSSDAAILCVGIRDLSIIAAGSSCAEVTDYLQRLFLVMDSIKLCFPRCFKLHAFGDRYMVVAGWEQYLPEEEKDPSPTKATPKQSHLSPGVDHLTVQRATATLMPPALMVESPSSNFVAELVAAPGSDKARVNAEHVYNFGFLLARILQGEFFERLWCAVRGVHWSPESSTRRSQHEGLSVAICGDVGRAAGILLAGSTLSYVAVGDAVSRCQRMVATASEGGFFVSAEFQRALSASVDPCVCTVLPDDRQKTAVEREIENVGAHLRVAPVLQSVGESVDISDHGQAQHHAVLPPRPPTTVSTVTVSGTASSPRNQARSSVFASQNVSSNTTSNVMSFSIGPGTAPPAMTSTELQAAGATLTASNDNPLLGRPLVGFLLPDTIPVPATTNPLEGSLDTSLYFPRPRSAVVQVESLVVSHETPVSQPAASRNPLAVGTSSSSLSDNTKQSIGSKPGTVIQSTPSTRSVVTQQQRMQDIERELQETSFVGKDTTCILSRFERDDVEAEYVKFRVFPSNRRRTTVFQQFFCMSLASCVYLTAFLISGESLFPAPSASFIVLISAAVAIVGGAMAVMWYPVFVEDWLLLAISVIHHAGCVTGLMYNIVHESDGSPSAGNAVTLWMVFHVCLTRITSPMHHWAVDVTLNFVWCAPFFAALAICSKQWDMGPGYWIPHGVAQFAVYVALNAGRVVGEDASRAAFATKLRLRELDIAYRKDAKDMRGLLERIIPNQALVDEVMPALLQLERPNQAHPPNPTTSFLGMPTAETLAARCKLMTESRDMAFMVCTMAFNGATSMPKRTSRRVVAMSQLRPVMRPMWEFFGELESLLQRHSEAAVVKTNGDMILLTPKNDRAGVEQHSTTTTTKKGCDAMLDLVPALLRLGNQVSGIQMRIVLGYGTLLGAILGSCALSLEYYGSAAFIAYELTQRALPQVIATDAFLEASGPTAQFQPSHAFKIGPLQTERIQQHGFINVRQLIFTPVSPQTTSHYLHPETAGTSLQ